MSPAPLVDLVEVFGTGWRRLPYQVNLRPQRDGVELGLPVVH